MQLRDGMEEEYRKYVEDNSDEYGAAVVSYSERWADMIEEEKKKGARIADIAKKTSHDADTEWITGFMYGCAVSALSHFWIHGEELRIWHNVDCQLGTEGEKANETGGVLNPALMRIDYRKNQ